MGYKATRFGVTKVVLGDGYWAELRPLSKRETEEFQADQADTPARTEAGERMLVRMIARWNLDDEQGNPLPIDQDTVRDLSLPDYTTLVGQIAHITNPLADPETAKK